MKKIFMILLVCSSLIAYSQKDTTSIPFYIDTAKAKAIFTFGISEWKILVQDSVCSVAYAQSGIKDIEIKGDTMSVIRLLLKTMEDREKEEMKLYDYISSSIEWFNHVPDYWKDQKNNCKWNAYYKEIRRMGYTIVSRKQPIKPDCK